MRPVWTIGTIIDEDGEDEFPVFDWRDLADHPWAGPRTF